MFKINDILEYDSSLGKHCLIKVLSKPEYSDIHGCYICEAIHVGGEYKGTMAYEFQLRDNVRLISRGIINRFVKKFEFV